MKKMLPVFVISVFLLFGLSGVKNADAQKKGGSQDVLKELDDFQKSLSNWMKHLDMLNSQFTTFQKNVSESLAPLKECDKMMKGIEEKLNNNMSKVESLEKRY